MAAQDVILGAQATRASVLKSSSSGQLGRKQVVLLTTKTFAAYKGDAGIRRAEALRQAMLETMQVPRFSHPAYWAPYALVGEGGR